MKDVHVTPPVYLGLLGALLAAIAAFVALQLPEIQRYLKIRSM
ncbi:MAG TPA: hypothetical protein VN213_02205 [Solirubrobacteraceae bacterium]|nr:hypothetical protein [Solirubrobacteraceae bacterium]